MTLAVDTNDTVALLVRGSCKDGLSRDTVHVDTLACLDLVKVDKAKLGDKVDDTVLFGNLHSDWEVVRRLWWEEDVDSLLGELGVGWLVANLDNVELESA